MDFLIKNYILTKWEYLFTNKSDLWFMQEFVKLIKNTDDLNIYKYFLNDIYLYMQIINIYLENIYINIIMPNK
jgi:hypothetical protein